jgi:PD-(D/E)XK nuclease superfamily
LSGKPDEVLRQGQRVAVLDHKYGSYRVDDPQENIQLGIYALLVSRGDEAIEEVTCQILSPYWDFEPAVYGREELDRLYRSTLVVVASLDRAPRRRQTVEFADQRTVNRHWVIRTQLKRYFRYNSAAAS